MNRLRARDVRFKAVGWGLAIDIIGGMCVGLVLGIVVSFATGLRPDLSREPFARAMSTVGVKAAGLGGTLFFTGLGGYVAARMSAPNGMTNAAIVGLLSVLLAVGLAVSVPGMTPLWKLVLGLIGTVPAALLGGRLAASRTTAAGTPS